MRWTVAAEERGGDGGSRSRRAGSIHNDTGREENRMARVRRWGTLALMVLAMATVYTVGGTRSWAGDDAATNEQEVTKPDAGSPDESATDATQSSSETETPANDDKDQ
jgi:hypothetical protein